MARGSTWTITIHATSGGLLATILMAGKAVMAVLLRKSSFLLALA